MIPEYKPLAEPLSRSESFVTAVTSISRSLLRMIMRPAIRDRGKVDREYDGGHWAQVLEERQWEHASGLKEFLVGTRTLPLVAKVEDRVCHLRSNEYYRYRLGAFARIIQSKFGEPKEIVELGCGYGYNLFSLALAFPHLRLIGLDISSNGITAARAIARYFGLEDRMQFAHLDLTRMDDPNYSLIQGREVFSFYCLEQIPHETEQVVKNIIAAGPRRIMHIEPAAEFLNGWRPRDWVNYLYVKSMDYQIRLLHVLRKLEQAGFLNIKNIENLPFAPTIQNDGIIVIWEPVVSQR